MTTSTSEHIRAAELPGGASPHRASRRRLAMRVAMIAVALIAFVALAPILLQRDPFTQHLEQDLTPPTWQYPCGQDKLGRDVLARIVRGGSISVGVGITVVAISLSLGLVLGSLAGMVGGRTDRAIMSIVDVFLAFPGLLMAIALVAVLGPSVHNVIFSLSIFGWTGYARLARGQMLSLREREYVLAAHALGARPLRVALRHLVPGVLGLLSVQATFGIAGAIVAEGSLSFLGLGVPPPIPSWGSMLADARPYLLIAPHLTLYPALALMLTVLAINYLGDRLRDHLEAGTDS